MHHNFNFYLILQPCLLSYLPAEPTRSLITVEKPSVAGWEVWLLGGEQRFSLIPESGLWVQMMGFAY